MDRRDSATYHSSLDFTQEPLRALRRLNLVCVTVVAIGVATAQAFPQGCTHGHDGGPPSLPIEILERPLKLREGIGKIHDPVTTSSKEAQTFYNQGIAYLHSYVWIEAARSFNQALRLDPRLAVAYIGLSRALSGLGSMQSAEAALKKAKDLASGVGPRERRRIDVRAKQLWAMAEITNPNRLLEYKKSLDDALALDAEDVELWLLRGNAEEPHAGGRGQRGGADSIRYYQRALALSPNHLAAHHYLVHSYENLNRIEEALKHGEVYAKLAPSVPHARHMYGHNLRRVGRIRDAILEFSKADELEIAYYRAESIRPEYDWHHQHNLDLLSTSYQYQGQIKTAEQLMRRSFSIPSMEEAQEFNKREWPGFLLARGRYNETLDAANTLKTGRWKVGRAIGHIMASHALMAMQKLDAASEEAKAAVREAQVAGSKRAIIASDLEVLQGEFFLRTGQRDKGRAILRDVQRKLRAEPGPDAWSQALFRLEAIGKIARQTNDWELTAYTAEQMREHDPAYGGTHYLLGLVAEQMGNTAVALEEFSKAEKLWREADEDFPELAQIRERLSHLRSQK